MAKTNSYYTLDMLVLSILKQGDFYGYEISDKMEEVSDGVVTIREGTLYPILYALLKKQFITGTEAVVNRKVRVYYHIEEAGIAYLEEKASKFRYNMGGVFKILDYGDKKRADEEK